MALRYLNHAGTSHPKSPAVRDAVARALCADPEAWRALYDEAERICEREFSGPAAFRIRFTTGCTAGLSLLLQAFSWIPGDALVTSALEHHALDREARALEAHRGIVRHVLPYTPQNGTSLKELHRHLKPGTVRLVALTHASNITGEVLPLREIAAMVHEAGALLLVDAAQTFGTDLFHQALNAADLIAVAGHKWAGGPQGIGIIAARPHVRFSCPSAVCEIGESAEETFLSFCDLGSVNLAGALGLATALEETRRTRKKAGQKMRALADALRAGLTARAGIRVLGTTAATERTPVVSFLADHIPLDRAQAHFLAHDLVVRAGTHCAPLALRALGAEAGCIRVSFGSDSTEDEVERVLAACDTLARS